MLFRIAAATVGVLALAFFQQWLKGGSLLSQMYSLIVWTPAFSELLSGLVTEVRSRSERRYVEEIQQRLRSAEAGARPNRTQPS